MAALPPAALLTSTGSLPKEMVDQDEISLKEVSALLWRERWIVLFITLTTAVLAGLSAWSLPIQYAASVVISPVQNNSGGGRLGAPAGQLGGLASLIGISLGGDSNRAESLAVLQSEALTERYISDNNLLPVLYEKQWDPVQKQWLGKDPRKHPTLWKANKKFGKLRTVIDDKKTSLVTVTIEWTDPQIAARWANDLVKLTNDTLRAKAIHESEQHIAYLNEQAANTDVSQVRTAIYAVLESEIKNVMLAKGPGDYALKVIDPAVPPELKSGPKLHLWVMGGFFIGLLLSTAVLFVRNALRAAAPAAPAAP
jgi:uncharacterized protein involved in exopolysaccharide biosynthesis